MRKFMTAAALAGLLVAPGLSMPAAAGPLPDQIEGWAITDTPHDWQTLLDRVGEAIAASLLNELNRASATMGARSLGETIPGNAVVDAFAPQFAIRMLDASIAAGIEAPLRFYITENEDGTATLSYKTASFVFAPYDDGGEALDELAAELEAIQAEIAADATAAE